MNDPMNQDYESLLRERLTPARLYHSQCVAQEAVRLADRYGADSKKAYLAGLLHDICKDEPKAQQLQRTRNSAIILDNKVLKSPSLWHAIAGSLFVRDVLMIADEDILNAICYHTSARAGMSLLEQVVYLADLTSADRTYSDVQQMRIEVEKGLREAMRYALRYTIGHLVEHHELLVDDTIAAYNESVASNPDGSR